MTPDVLIMSMKAWRSLSPADQNIFRNAARDSSMFLRGQWKNWEASFRCPSCAAAASGDDLKSNFQVKKLARRQPEIRTPRQILFFGVSRKSESVRVRGAKKL
jgi:hypothetical protein